MVRALFKFAKLPSDVVVVDTTSNTHPVYRDLSPFILTVPCSLSDTQGKLFGSIIFENLWQFSKVYPQQIGDDGLPSKGWHLWREQGWQDVKAHRYPMGKGVIPLYSWWEDQKLGYIEARKKIYAPIYAENVIKTDSFKRLREQYGECCLRNKEMILLDYDAYDYLALNMSLIDVINNPKRKMGHAFVLIMMLTDMLEECLNH